MKAEIEQMIRNEFIIDAYTSVCNTKSYAASHKNVRLRPKKEEAAGDKEPASHSAGLSKPEQNFQYFTHTKNVRATLVTCQSGWLRT